jgi:hypothetical protein
VQKKPKKTTINWLAQVPMSSSHLIGPHPIDNLCNRT